LIRIKTYLSDGSNPNGRLFAPDLNALQDAVAALTDTTQHLTVGDITLNDVLLSRFGAGQAQLAASLRVTAGIQPGTFTTTQRDAIASGRRPTGLIIYNSTTAQLEINLGSDATPNWQGLQVGGAGTLTGAIAANGTVNRGTGFTITKGTTGVYTINFSVAFANPPIVVANASGGANIVNVASVSTTSALVGIVTSGSWAGPVTAADDIWNFIAMAVH
jgi:hypothetical protein